MTNLDLDRLFLIAEAAPILEKVEKALANDRLEVTYLHKLQADAGVQINREMNGFDPHEPAPGPRTALLNQSFVPVTEPRLSILAQVHALLPAGNLKNDISALMQKLNVAPLSPPKSLPTLSL